MSSPRAGASVSEGRGRVGVARALLVEDNPGDARMICKVLASTDGIASVDHCRDGEEALAILQAGRHQLVVIDQGLPGMSGLELGRAIDEHGLDVARVMLTGAGDERLAVQALKGGFDDYVVKDITLAYRELLPVVATEVLRRRADRVARAQAEKALIASEERYTLAVQGANDAIWDWDLRTNQLYLSRRWHEMLGIPASGGSSVPQDWFERVHPQDLAALRQDLDAHLQGLTPHLEAQCRIRHENGTWRWLLCRGLCVRGDDGAPVRVAGSHTDITDRRVVEERLLHDAFHDSLTGLANRARFLDQLRLAVKAARTAPGVHFAVIFLDLDGFKIINDSLGHLAGDQLLIQVAQRLNACARPSDTVARFGGDELALLLEDLTTRQEAVSVAERLRRELSRPFQITGRELVAGASMGIALGDGGYERAEDVLRDADTAMYRAKQEARGSYRIFDPAMHVVAASRLQLEGDLRRALDIGELVIHYQPIVSLETGLISSFESLVRWQHPERGLLMPDEFLPVAEETGLILRMGHFVLDAACRQLRQWQRLHPQEPPLEMAVNLSARQFGDPEILGRIATSVRDSGIQAKSLRLEMTESAIVASEESVAAKLWQLRSLKVGIALDDFGTGYSALSYLRHFPIDVLKIDRSFIRGLTGGGQDAAIVRTVVELAKSLGMQTVAEGVETEEQLEVLRAMGCGAGQGYLFAKALPPGEAGQLLAEGRRW